MIRSFGSYTVQQLDQMKRDLSIRMPMPKLAFCASYYRSEKRDPSIAELEFLDRLSERAENAALSIAPTELLTNDAFVAKTYADVMKKRHELNPDAKNPCTLSEMARLAGAYLERIGKKEASDNLLCALQKNHNPYAKHMNQVVSLPDSDVRLCVLPKGTQSPAVGDLLLLVRPASKHSVSNCDAPIEKLLNTPDLTAQIKQLRTVGAYGLFTEVLNLTSSATVEPDRLSETGEPIPLSMLLDAYEGDLLVRISRDRYPDFAKGAYALGVRATAFAVVTNGTAITVVRPKAHTFTLQTRFLRALFPLHPVSARLGNERDGVLAPIAHTMRPTAECAYLHADSPLEESQTATVGSAVCAVASVAPTQCFFRNALDTALSTVLTLAASGCDYTEQTLAFALGLPRDCTAPAVAAGNAISTVLGLYRLQAELALSATAIHLDCSDAQNTPTLHVFSVSRGTPCPSAFTAAGNHVYCLAPAVTDGGIPDFQSLRGLLTQLTALRKSGVLQSARVLCREAVTDAIRTMSSERFGCLTRGNEVIAADVLPIGILIETSTEIPAAKIGVVTARPETLTPTVQKVLPMRERLIHTDSPEVVIVSTETDRDAFALAELLTASGAEVSHLLTDGLDAVALSRKLLTATTVILCGRVTLPDTPQVRFALDTAKRAGGRILLLGGAEVAPLSSGIALPDGIYPKMIAQICQK